MVVSMDQYATLRRDFLAVAKFHLKSEALNNLKILYKPAINSIRTLNYIDDIESLIKILEKRGVIRYNNITPMIHIAREYFPCSVINQKLDEYNNLLKSDTSPYLPQANLYQLRDGECYLPNTTNCAAHPSNLHYASHPNNAKLHSGLNYNFLHRSQPILIIDNELGSINLKRVPPNTKISFINNVDLNNRDTRVRKDCEIRVVSYKTYSIAEKKEGVLVNHDSDVTAPSTSIVENGRNKACALIPTMKDLDASDALLSTPLISTPQLVKSETVCSPKLDNFSSCHSPSRLNLKKKVNVRRHSIKIFIKRRYAGILFTVLSVVIVLSTILIMCHFLKNSVNYIPESSAPLFQEVYSGNHEALSIPHAGNSSRLDQLRPGYNVTMQFLGTVTNLQSLSEKQAKIQEFVFRKVSRELGKYWRDVARLLGVREYEIDAIDARHDFTLPDKGYEILKRFAAETDLEYWQKKLMKALEEARRKDLKEAVEELLSRKYS